MDSTAFSLCMDNKIPIIVFDMNSREQLHGHRARANSRNDRLVTSRSPES